MWCTEKVIFITKCKGLGKRDSTIHELKRDHTLDKTMSLWPYKLLITVE